jgi:hypothetical protein
MLDPGVPAENPFLHDRIRTFQPRDLWEGLLKLAIILFPLDVGVRRVQIDKAEWLNATATLRRWLFFWRGTPRTPEADESLAALLARRDQVRSKQTAPTVQPGPDLFKPERPVVVTPAKNEIRPVEPATAPSAEAPGEAKLAGPTTSTTSRLLEAKRRAQQRKEP